MRLATQSEQTAPSPTGQRGSPNFWFLAAAGILCGAWLILAIALSVTRPAWSNEAWSAIPAVNLTQHGTMATTVLEFRNNWLHGLDHHTYWLMPVHILAQAAWYKLFGFSLFKQRLLSVLFALILLAAWYRIVVLLMGSRVAALFTSVLLGFQAIFLNGAANGRMDMMCASLGSAAIAAWLELRTVSPRAAILVAHTLAAGAVFTHPCGLFFAGALGLISVLMPGRARLWDCYLAAIPYLIGAGLWGMYIAQAPSDFQAQFFGNASGFAGEYSDRSRWNGFLSPVRAIVDEVRLRFLDGFGFSALRSRQGVYNASWLVITVSAAACAFLLAGLRRQRGVRILGAAALLVFLMMALLEGMKYPHYLIYPLPFLASLAATAGVWMWTKKPRTRVPLAAGLLVVTLPQIQQVVTVIRLNPMRNELGFVANYLRTNTPRGEFVLGGAELGYLLGFNEALRDDVRLGYQTAIRPEFIVTSGWYRQWFDAAQRKDPAAYRHIERVLGEFREQFARGEYRVYRRAAP